METEIHQLNLITPLYCIPDKTPDPFDCGAIKGSGSVPGEESIFCFELDEDLFFNFEPDKNRFLEHLVFGGKAAASGGKGRTEIPGGNYLFAQKREFLGKEDIINLAVEIQMEGLWQRLKPGKNIYLRYLYEDDSWVTQLFRPYF